MFKISHKIILETMVVFILTVISITSFYATFLPDTKFLFFEETYLELLALTETGGNGKLNLLTYPLGLYFICIFTCVQYLSLIHISEPTRRIEISYAVFCLKKFFFNDTATTEIYTNQVVGSVRCV